jgi:hypothetical protein
LAAPQDLVAPGLLIELDLAAALTHLIGFAINQPVHLALIEHRAQVPFVAGLRPALALTGSALRPVGLAWAI